MSVFACIKADEAKKYISVLAQKVERHFDLFFDETREGEFFDLYAYHRQDFHKSFITRATVYEGFSVFEHLLIRVCDSCTESDVAAFQDMLVTKARLFAKPDKFHKKSTLNGILICRQPVCAEAGKAAKTFFHRENYKWCFHGWSETATSLVSLSDKIVYASKRNKDLGKLLSF